MMVDFIEEHRSTYGVEPICRELPIAPSTYYEHRRQRLDPSRRCARWRRDAELTADIKSTWTENLQVYGVRKVWRSLRRRRPDLARCTVERLMKREGIRGVVRGRVPKTTVPGPAASRPEDLVKRQFKADRPDRLWVADFTYVSTWVGFVYVAFIVDAFSRRIVGWRVSKSMTTAFVLDALEQALHDRDASEDLVHHNDQGAQYLSISYTERLASEGIRASVGRVGDSYDNALAETINGLFKTEVIRRRTAWKTMESVELATLHWVAWFNQTRLLEPLGYLSPDEFERAWRTTQATPDGA